MNRSRKTKILSQFLSGQPALLRQLKCPDQPPTIEELRSMTTEHVLLLFRSGVELDPQKLTTVQLEAIIKAEYEAKGEVYRDPQTMTDEELHQNIMAAMSDEQRADYRATETLTDEELDQILAKGRVYKEPEAITDAELDQTITFLEARTEKDKRRPQSQQLTV